MYRPFLLLALLNIFGVPFEVAQTQPANGTQRTQCVSQDHTDATIQYISMKMHGRKIFGGVVPYGKLWEMSDQRSPTFIAGSDLVVGGEDLPAGKYRLVTIPRPDRWTLIFRKLNDEKGSVGKDEVAKLDLRVKRLPLSLESFTILFDQFRGGCVLNLRWEESEVSVLVARK